MSKKQNKKVSQYEGTYVAMSKYIFDLTDIGATDKIVLAWFDSFDSNSHDHNYLKSSTIASTLNMSVSAINTVIKRLVLLGYLSEQYYNGRRRRFKSELCPSKTEGVFSLISTDVLKSSIASTYKITAGVIINDASGDDNFLAGYNYSNVKTLAKRLGLSKASTYRHITELISYNLLVRNNKSNWLLQPKDSYSLKHVTRQNKRKAELIRSGKLKVQHTADLSQAPPTEYDAATIEAHNNLMDSVYARV